MYALPLGRDKLPNFGFHLITKVSILYTVKKTVKMKKLVEYGTKT